MIRGPDPRELKRIMDDHAPLAALLKGTEKMLDTAITARAPLSEDELGDIVAAGEAAAELLDAIDSLDDCRCDDPYCPCTGEKRWEG